MAEIKAYENVCAKTFREQIYPLQKPAVLKGLDLGPCMKKWDVKYLQDVDIDSEVKIHVSKEDKMDFINKNFLYR